VILKDMGAPGQSILPAMSMSMAKTTNIKSLDVLVLVHTLGGICPSFGTKFECLL
jgi:hypothetical protein